MLNVEETRKAYAIYSNEPNLVYLDSAATSLTPDVVVDSMTEYYKVYRATVHRTMYKTGVKADERYRHARKNIASFMNSGEDEIIFTKSVTAALNSLARALIEKLNQDDEILLSELEHHSNLLPWRENAKKRNIKVNYVNLENNKITVDAIKKSITPNTKIISINHVSNVLGELVNIKEIAKVCQEENIILVVDGAQAITHEKVDVKDLGCDFYAYTGHKMYGPTGIGVLYGRKELLHNLIFDYGGDMAHLVTKDELVSVSHPVALEAGTPAIAEVIGLSSAIDYINDIGMDNIRQHVYEVRLYCLEKLQELDDIIIYNANIKSNLITFNLDKIPTHDALHMYAQDDICLRGGNMCNQLTLKLLDVNGVLRVSFNVFNSKEDVDKFITSTKKINEEFSWMK